MKPEQAEFRKSSYSMTNGNCVEVGIEDQIMIRDTTTRDVTLMFPGRAWSQFIDSVKASC